MDLRKGILRALAGKGAEDRQAAAGYVAHLVADPSDADVAWLTAIMLSHDDDHARWELRYARRALGLLVAERDALDDRTPSLVADALEAALERDPNVAAAKVDVALAQFNVRLAAYREAFRARNPREALAPRLAREILSFSTAVPKDRDLAIAEGAVVMSRFMSDAADALRRAFGEAKLPEDIPPSQIAGG
ncbi:MAG: hypothetical protein HY275_06625 [Gemmatimonadetes bacterium]|nr:hypothetical protein [Gemmatimonadota bacterium]